MAAPDTGRYAGMYRRELTAPIGAVVTIPLCCTKLAADISTVPTRVLCVDDDPGLLRAIKRTLGFAGGFVVETVTSAAQAREKLAVGDFAVLVTDYEMPDESGIELLASVASRSDTVPVLLTAHAQLDIALEAINRGHVHAFLTKPFEPQQLLATVRTAAERFELGRALHQKVAELEHANHALRLRNQELERARQEVLRLQEQAATDAKTGAHSYRHFMDRLEEEVARAQRYELPLSLLLIDLDGFKAVNDRCGHVAGDRVLRAVADALRSGVRVMDVVARYGGDEFTVLLPNTTKVGAAVLGERLRVAIGSASLAGTGAGEITTSIGIASMPDPAIGSLPELVEAADQALYYAKDAGRNRCVLASPTALRTRPRRR